MILYALCINPLLSTLEKKLPGIRLYQNGPLAKVVAYADNVSIFVTTPADIQIIQQRLKSYEDASGARVNTRKSKALAIGPWDSSIQIMDIPHYMHKPVTLTHGNSAWTEESNSYMTTY